MTDFTKGPIGKQIILFSLPIIAGSFLMQFYQTVDSIIVGQYLGKEALAAVGASSPVVFAVIAMVIGIGSGASVVISQYFGRGNYEKVRITSETLHIILLVCGALIGLLGVFFSDNILRFTGLPEEVIPLGTSYLQVYLGGIFLMFGFNTISSIMRGVGNSKLPLYFLAISSFLNILLDYIFIVYCGWGVASAAWATVIAEGLAYFAAIYYINRRKDIIFNINLFKLRFNRKIFNQCIRFGVPTGIQQTFVAFGGVAIMSIVNSMGTNTIAGYTIGMRVDAIAVIPAMNFAMALTSFVGQNIGVKNFKRVQQGLLITLLYSSIVCIILTGIIILFGNDILSLFTTDTAVVQIGQEYLVIVSLFFLLFSTMFILSGLFRGAGAVMFPMISTAVALWAVRIPCAAWLSSSNDVSGIDAIAWSIVIGWGVGMISSVWYYASGKWKGKSIFDVKKS